MRQLNDLNGGKLYRSGASIDKRNVMNTTLLVQDRQNTLIERGIFENDPRNESPLSLEEWLESIDKVSREEIIEVAKTINLQSVYFMEGK